jgi:hypothetical protein
MIRFCGSLGCNGRWFSKIDIVGYEDVIKGGYVQCIVVFLYSGPFDIVDVSFKV